MSIKIAGRNVRIGERLYYAPSKVWGEVVRFDTSGPAVLEIPITPRGTRLLYVQQGGIVNGIRAVYWHPPLILDVPVENIDKLQGLVDLLAAELYGKGGNHES